MYFLIFHSLYKLCCHITRKFFSFLANRKQHPQYENEVLKLIHAKGKSRYFLVFFYYVRNTIFANKLDRDDVPKSL